MQRIVNLVRRSREPLWLCRRYVTDAEFEEKLFLKGPLDPAAVDLMKKFESDIVYSSYVENNKKPISYKHKQILREVCEQHKRRAMYEGVNRKPFSLALQYSTNELVDDTPEEAVKPIVTTQDTIPVANGKLNGERDTSRQIILNEAKLEIFRQMRERQNEIEDTPQPKYPDKWMSDYETFDEDEDDDLTADAEYGTPGMWPCGPHFDYSVFRSPDTPLFWREYRFINKGFTFTKTLGYMGFEGIQMKHHEIKMPVLCAH